MIIIVLMNMCRVFVDPKKYMNRFLSFSHTCICFDIFLCFTLQEFNELIPNIGIFERRDILKTLPNHRFWYKVGPSQL